MHSGINLGIPTIFKFDEIYFGAKKKIPSIGKNSAEWCCCWLIVRYVNTDYFVSFQKNASYLLDEENYNLYEKY